MLGPLVVHEPRGFPGQTCSRGHLVGYIGALITSGVSYTIIIIRSPNNSIGNYLSPYST